MDEVKPSEALFVRCLLPHCKRMSAVWLKNTRILRECHRTQRSKTHKHGKTKERSSKCSNTEHEDVVAMVTVLRKIYKEVAPPSVMALIRCWLGLVTDVGTDGGGCVLTRGDSRGRMRRIDGGKGPDKVWRLDTLVGMLYHGLPLTSADSSLVHHSCHHELCVRPQHLRVRLSSLAVVLVLKALSQAGYSIQGGDPSIHRPDEFVDISGPFSIQKLDVLRHEFVKIDDMENYKLTSSPSDIFILDQNPTLKKYYMVNSKRISSPLSNIIAKPQNVLKRQLLFRLIENSKQDKILSEELQDKNTNNRPKEKVPVEPNSQELKRCATKRLVGASVDNTDEKQSNHNDNKFQISFVSQPLEGEEKELVEIMTAQTTKRKCDWMDSMIEEMEQSPSKSVLDRLMKDIKRSGSGSEKDFRDDRTLTNSKLWNNCKSNELEEANFELLDILHNMRPSSKSDFCFKMTPNIFSPILDTDDFQAAE